jgi:hypothetical protein
VEAFETQVRGAMLRDIGEGMVPDTDAMKQFYSDHGLPDPGTA